MIRIALALLAMTSLVAAHAGDTAFVRLIGNAHTRDCPGCQFAGEDLTNQCVKGGDLRGANFSGARLVLACMSHADFQGASFRHADLTGANMAHAVVTGADFTGANLRITSIKGTDLTHAKGLTQDQLDMACGDAKTRVPAGMKVQSCE